MAAGGVGWNRKDEAQAALAADPRRPPAGGRYRHHKGGLYRVVCASVFEPSGTPLVTYSAEATGEVWTRTLDDWCRSVTLPDGSTVPRFQEVSD